jgi:hypothetical protein
MAQQERGGTERESAAQIIESVRDRVRARREPEVGDVINVLGRKSYAPLLMVPGLALVSPLSGIPGFSSICGITIALVSLQMMAHRRVLWLPKWLRHRHLDKERGPKVIGWFRRPARWLDRVSRNRMALLTRRPLVVVPLSFCLLAGLIIPFLEMLPFTSSILGGVVAIIGAGLFARDGLITLLGMGLVIAAVSAAIYAI